MGQGGGGGFKFELPDLNKLFQFNIRAPSGEEIGSSIGQGVKDILRPFDEAIGEVSGRNMGREQLYLAEKRLKEETAYRNKLIADEQEKTFRMDVQASQAASRTSQRGSRSGERTTLGTRSVSAPVGQPIQQKDFLGL